MSEREFVCRIYTDSAFCLCNESTKRGGLCIKGRQNIPNSSLFENDTYCSLFLGLFLSGGGGWGEEGGLISVRFGGGTNTAGELRGGAVLAVLAHV